MQACMLFVGILLTGQVTGASGTRYQTEGSGNTVDASQRPLWADQVESHQQGPGTSQPNTPPNLGSNTKPAAPKGAQDQPPATTSPAEDNRYSLGPSTPIVTPPNKTAPIGQQPAEIGIVAKSQPSQLIRTLLKPPTLGQLPGVPLSLADALRSATTRSQQTQRVEAYWDLSAAVTDYYLAVRETTELGTLRASVSQPSPRWEQAKQALDARAKVARRSAQAAQYRLQHMMDQSGESTLPLPSNVPHCGAYNTRYDKIFSDRRSREAQQLHELLPLRYRDLKSQAAGVAAARQWLDTVSERRNPQTDGTGLLKAHELLILRRRAFVYTIRDYNTRIARYAEMASPGQVTAERLVAMLIQVSSSERSAWNRPRIKRTSAEEEPDTHYPTSRPLKTFADSQWNQAQPIPTTPSAEHSILVEP